MKQRTLEKQQLLKQLLETLLESPPPEQQQQNIRKTTVTPDWRDPRPGNAAEWATPTIGKHIVHNIFFVSYEAGVDE